MSRFLTIALAVGASAGSIDDELKKLDNKITLITDEHCGANCKGAATCGEIHCDACLECLDQGRVVRKVTAEHCSANCKGAATCGEIHCDACPECLEHSRSGASAGGRPRGAMVLEAAPAVFAMADDSGLMNAAKAFIRAAEKTKETPPKEKAPWENEPKEPQNESDKNNPNFHCASFCKGAETCNIVYCEKCAACTHNSAPQACQCFANGQENEAFCESGSITDPSACQSDNRCHWGPSEQPDCAAMVTGPY